MRILSIHILKNSLVRLTRNDRDFWTTRSSTRLVRTETKNNEDEDNKNDDDDDDDASFARDGDASVARSSGESNLDSITRRRPRSTRAWISAFRENSSRDDEETASRRRR